MVHVYKSVNDLFSAFRRNKPISCVKYYDGTFKALIENQITSTTVMLPIGLQFTKTWPQLAMNFHKVTMDFSKTDLDLYDIGKEKILNYVLLLPELDKDGFIHKHMFSSYYIIDSEWNELDTNLKFAKPKTPYCKY